MSDLIERLNELCERHRLDGSHLAHVAATSNLPAILAAIREAAAEIARLRAELTTAADAATDLQRAVFRLTDEVERLRANDARWIEDYIRLRELWKLAPVDVGFLRVAYPDVGDFKRAFDGWLRKQGVDIDAAIDEAIKEAGNG